MPTPINLLTPPRDAVRPMTLEETEIFVTLALDEHYAPVFLTAPDLYEELLRRSNGKLPFLLEVLVRRLSNAEGLVFSYALVVWCAAMAHNPGSAVMWAWSLIQSTRKHGPLSLTLWATELSPSGVPNDAFLETAWDAQKDPNSPAGNYLDNPQAYAA